MSKGLSLLAAFASLAIGYTTNRSQVLSFSQLSLGSIANAEVAVTPFVLKSLDGKDFNLADSLGKKTIVLNFWAAWCTTCEEEIPELKALKNKHPEFLYVGINSGEKDSKARRFVEKNNYPYFVVLDPEKTTANSYKVVGLPTTIIIGKNKNIIFRGSRPPETISNK